MKQRQILEYPLLSIVKFDVPVEIYNISKEVVFWIVSILSGTAAYRYLMNLRKEPSITNSNMNGIEPNPNITNNSPNPKPNNLAKDDDVKQKCFSCGSTHIGLTYTGAFQDDMDWIDMYEERCNNCNTRIREYYR